MGLILSSDIITSEPKDCIGQNICFIKMVKDLLCFLRGHLQPCTAKPIAGADPRSGRWAGQDKTECGIHVVGGRIERVAS